MDVLISHRHGAETRATDVVSHGNTGDQWYRLDHTDGSTSLVPMDSIMIVSFRDDAPAVDPELADKMREAMKPKKRPGALALELEADIREPHGAEPAELAAFLVRKGWKRDE